MSVKKMGTKLAQGVHQVKARQNEGPPDVGLPPIPVARTKPVRSAAKPEPAKVSKSGALHPHRIWPD
ncbi:MAG: hypothetical protein GJU77_02205 [Ferrovum sp.]|jgi:hypothetical protein|nr:hypothetical protein [Ferrovum sp.]